MITRNLQQLESQRCYPKVADVIKIGVIGDADVGKTAFMKCFVLGLYDPYMSSMLKSNFMTRTVDIDDENVVLQLWESVPQSYHCLVVIYDITSRQSYLNAQKLMEDARLRQGDQLPILLLGNKLDSDNKRQVMTYEGEMSALRCQALFSEISCTEAINVRQSMVEFVESMLMAHHKIPTE